MAQLARLLRPGNVLVVGLIVATTSAMTALSIVSMTRGGSAAADPEPPTGLEVAAAMARAGLTPEALAAVGVDTATLTTVRQAARSWADEHHDELETARADVRSARADLADARAVVQSGRGDQQDVNDLDAAASALSSAESTRETLLDGLFDDATATLTSDQRDLLTTIAANSARTCPVPYRCVDRTESAWRQLRDALAAERIADRRGTQLEDEFASFLATADANADVSSAQDETDQHLANLRDAFNNAGSW